MSKNWPTVKLRDVLTPAARDEVVDASKEYRLLGIRLDGQGPFLRETLMGTQTSATKLFRVAQGDFIYSRLFACRGAFGVINKELDGCYVSGEFPTFIPVKDKVDVEFLKYCFRLPSVIATVDEDCSGSTPLTRNRFKENFFLALEIPLPPLAEQRRVVARIEELAAQIHEARTLRDQAAEEADSLIASCLMHLFDEAAEAKKNQTRLGDVCTFQGGSQPAKLQFAYEPRDGYVRLIQIRDYKSDDYRTFVPKDSVRKFCKADDVMIGRYGPPIFQILRGIEGAYNVALMKATPSEGRVSKDFLFRLLQEPRLFQKVEEDSQRTSGQTGIRRELLEDHITFVPPLAEQRRIVAELDALQAEVGALKRLQAETAAELDALLPSILDKAFKGEL